VDLRIIFEANVSNEPKSFKLWKARATDNPMIAMLPPSLFSGRPGPQPQSCAPPGSAGVWLPASPHEPATTIPKSAKPSSGISDHCRIYVFPDHEIEARYVASRVARALEQDGITPRDVCILVKQKAAVYSSAIIAALEAVGIRARNESELQDLLAEPITRILVAFLTLGVSQQAPADWAVATETLALARRVDIESAEMRKVEDEVSERYVLPKARFPVRRCALAKL
jgi:hypothetical protein